VTVDEAVLNALNLDTDVELEQERDESTSFRTHVRNGKKVETVDPFAVALGSIYAGKNQAQRELDNRPGKVARVELAAVTLDVADPTPTAVAPMNCVVPVYPNGVVVTDVGLTRELYRQLYAKAKKEGNTPPVFCQRSLCLRLAKGNAKILKKIADKQKAEADRLLAIKQAQEASAKKQAQEAAKVATLKAKAEALVAAAEAKAKALEHAAMVKATMAKAKAAAAAASPKAAAAPAPKKAVAAAVAPKKAAATSAAKKASATAASKKVAATVALTGKAAAKAQPAVVTGKRTIHR